MSSSSSSSTTTCCDHNSAKSLPPSSSASSSISWAVTMGLLSSSCCVIQLAASTLLGMGCLGFAVMDSMRWPCRAIGVAMILRNWRRTQSPVQRYVSIMVFVTLALLPELLTLTNTTSWLSLSSPLPSTMGVDTHSEDALPPLATFQLQLYIGCETCAAMVGSIVNGSATAQGCALVAMSIYKRPDNYLNGTLPSHCSHMDASGEHMDRVLNHMVAALAAKDYTVTARSPPPLTSNVTPVSSTIMMMDSPAASSSSSSFTFKPSSSCPPEAAAAVRFSDGNGDSIDTMIGRTKKDHIEL